MRTPDADDRVLVGIVERGAEPDAGFGARVARREARAEPAARLLREPGRDRTAARDDVLHRLEVEGVEVGIAQHERELRRHAGDRRHAFAREQFERGPRVPAFHDERGAAAPQIAGELRHEAEVRERRAAERATAAVPGVADIGLRDERELAVAVERALRQAGGARREDDRDRAIGIGGRAAGGASPVDAQLVQHGRRSTPRAGRRRW